MSTDIPLSIRAPRSYIEAVQTEIDAGFVRYSPLLTILETSNDMSDGGSRSFRAEIRMSHALVDRLQDRRVITSPNFTCIFRIPNSALEYGRMTEEQLVAREIIYALQRHYPEISELTQSPSRRTQEADFIRDEMTFANNWTSFRNDWMNLRNDLNGTREDSIRREATSGSILRSTTPPTGGSATFGTTGTSRNVSVQDLVSAVNNVPPPFEWGSTARDYQGDFTPPRPADLVRIVDDVSTPVAISPSTSGTSFAVHGNPAVRLNTNPEIKISDEYLDSFIKALRDRLSIETELSLDNGELSTTTKLIMSLSDGTSLTTEFLGDSIDLEELING